MVGQPLGKRVVAHHEELLTAAALAFGITSSLPIGHAAQRSVWELALAVIAWLPLVARNRWPLPVAALVVVLDSANIAVAGHHHPASAVTPVATMLALYTVSARMPALVVWPATGAAAVVQMSVAATGDLDWGAVALHLNWALTPTVLGRFVTERRTRIAAAEERAAAAEASKAAEAQRQVTAERIRIAHELHDVLAHHITVVNAQAGVAKYLLHANPEAAEQALTGITENTRAALEELRATLGVLRPDGVDAATTRDAALPPAPGADRLPALLDSFTQAGMSLDRHTSGTPRPLATATDLALYRITQEALTNASKHAAGSRVSVRLEWAEDAVTVTVANQAPVSRQPVDAAQIGTGNGLLGMRERAAAAGGTLDAGATPDGGYRVAARLPVSTGRISP
ncbi:MAG: sensor histidine kinase [Frankiaceae bacterium]|nr:sensor histidine kinase [Frankiaceae bacterium]